MDTSEMHEHDCFEKLKDGDALAFEQIVTAYQGPVFNLCYQMLGDKANAEDAAQEIFLKAYRRFDRYDPTRKFINWILTIASNHCIDCLRRKKRDHTSIERGWPWLKIPSGDPTPEDQAINVERQKWLRSLLDDLNELDHVVIVLFYWYSYSYQEIAETFFITPSGVKSRLHRARRRLVALADSKQAGMTTLGTVGRNLGCAPKRQLATIHKY